MRTIRDWMLATRRDSRAVAAGGQTTGHGARDRLVLAGLVITLLVTGGCASPGPPMAELAEEINQTLTRGVYRISAGDVIEVSFPYQPEWSHRVTVRPDGRVTFLSVGELDVAGRTIEAVTKHLSELYSELSTSGVTPVPTINVSLLSTDNEAAGLAHQVLVLGEVTNPGAIVLGGAPLSLVEAIGRAGGPLKKTALLEELLLVRLLPDDGRRVWWKIDASVEQWGLSPPILLQAHDVIFVPNTPIDDVNIWVEQYIRNMLPFGVGIAIPTF